MKPEARWPRCCGAVIAVECLLTVTILAMHQSGRLGLFLQSPGEFLTLNMEAFVSVSGSAEAAQEAHRRTLLNFDKAFSNSSSSSPSSRRNGIRAALVHRPSQCSPPSSGTNSSLGLSKQVQRVQHLKCALQRSSSRVKFLLSRKSRDRQTTDYGLPTKHIGLLQEFDESELGDEEFSRELLESPEWEDSYESEVWSQPGEYIMTVQVGTPPRSLKGIVDTGSDLTWLQCRRCRPCYEQSDPIYEPTYSSTYTQLNCEEDRCEDLPTSFCNVFTDSCDYMYTYGDDSYTYGALSTDTFALRSTTGGKAHEFPKIAFGCSHSSRGTFTHTRADGVVALGQGALSLASQLGRHLSNRFAYCLVSRTEPTSIMSPIYFGDAALLTGPGAGYTPILVNERHRAYYYVNMTGISVGGKRLDIPPAVFAMASEGSGGTIVDSGTTVTNLRGGAYYPLLDAMSAAVQYPISFSETHFDLCFDVSGDSDPRFPTLVFHLDGVDLDLPLENYMMEAEDQTRCLAIDRSTDRLSVIGNVQQQNFHVLYDRENSRMGFRPTNCAQE